MAQAPRRGLKKGSSRFARVHGGEGTHSEKLGHRLVAERKGSVQSLAVALAARACGPKDVFG